jgi:5-methylcytosine-specific restriction endonuclease McrA
MSSRAKKFTQLPGTKRNAEGVKVCCWCEGALSGQRKRWCSQKCVDDYLARSSQTGLRTAVARRDRGVCAGCGFQAERVERILNLLAGIAFTRINQRRVEDNEPGALGVPYRGWKYESDTHPAAERRREQLLLAVDLVNLHAGSAVVRFHGGQRVSTRTLWEADHIVPLAEGGAPGPENARALCLRCHKAASAALAARLAAARRPQLPLALQDRNATHD